MTRLAIDALAAVRIAREGTRISPAHSLVGPNLLRSEALQLVYSEFRAGQIDEREAQRILDGVTTMKIRLLGDRVSRGRAFRLAADQGWESTGPAE